MEIYIPTDSIFTKQGSQRYAFQGFPGTGKTHLACQFPNPYFVDFDHKAPDGYQSAPFWDPVFVEKLIPAGKNMHGPLVAKRASAILKWLRLNNPKFHPEQTLVFDSYTMMDSAFHQELEENPEKNDKGQIDTRAGWGRKLVWGANLFELIRACPCNVIMTFHETEKTNREGDIQNKLRPVCTGSLRDTLYGHFNVAIRLTINPDDKGVDGKTKMNGPIPAKLSGHYMQVISDDLFEVIKPPTWKATTFYEKTDYANLMRLMGR